MPFPVNGHTHAHIVEYNFAIVIYVLTRFRFQHYVLHDPSTMHMVAHKFTNQMYTYCLLHFHVMIQNLYDIPKPNKNKLSELQV